MSHSSKSISIIIPTLNAEKSIEKIIKALRGQTWSPLEIIIVDSSSDDKTVDIALGLEVKTLVIPRKQFNHGLTRNYGAMHAKGEFVIFMTQDALPFNDTMLEMLIQPLSEGNAVACYARQIPYANANPIERFWRAHNYPMQSESRKFSSKSGRKYFFSNVCSAYNRSTFDEVGGFAEVDTNEDMLMAYKLLQAGYTVLYCAEAQVYHSHNLNLSQSISRYFSVGRFMKKHRYLEVEKSNEKEGLYAVYCLIKYLIYSKNKKYIPVAFADMLTRYLAYIFGGLSYRIRN